MSFNPATDCSRDDCRVREYPGSTTCMYYPPVYDKYGNNINPDGNITTYDKHCYTCGKRWVESHQYGKRIEDAR